MTSYACPRSYVTVPDVAAFDFGAVLTAVMNEQEVSASELARRLGTDVRKVRRWKNSHSQPQSYSVVADLAAALGVSVTRFSADAQVPPPSGAPDAVTGRRRERALDDLELLAGEAEDAARSNEDDDARDHQAR